MTSTTDRVMSCEGAMIEWRYRVNSNWFRFVGRPGLVAFSAREEKRWRGRHWRVYATLLNRVPAISPFAIEENTP